MSRSISRAAIALLLSTLVLTPFKVASAATGDILRVFANPTPALGDNFGVSIAAVGPNVLVGADSDNTGFTDSGSAYLLNGDTGELMLSIHNPTPAVNETFGRTVAAHGTDLLISANRFTGTTGEAMLFDGTTGGLMWNLRPATDTVSRPQYGRAMSSWGQEIIVGAPGANSPAFLFETATGNELQSVSPVGFPSSEGTWGGTSGFGITIAELEAGFAVGSPGGSFRPNGESQFGSVGGVFIYDNGALPALSLRRPGEFETGVRNGFGASIAARGGDLLVGDDRSLRYRNVNFIEPGAAFLFDTTTGELRGTFAHPSPSSDDEFGRAVAVVGWDILVSAATDDEGNPGGAVFLFDGLTGDLLHTYRNPSPATIANFGYSVWGPSLSAFGNHILIGASDADVGAVNSGAVYLFEGYTPRGGRTDLTLTLGQITALAPMFEEPENPVSGAIFSQRPLDGGIEFEVSLADSTGGEPPMALVGLGATAGGLGLTDLTGHDRFSVMVTNTDNSAWSVAAYVQADGGERYQGTPLRLPPGASHTIDLDLLAIPGGEAALANIASLGLVIVGQLDGAGGNPSNSDIAHLLVKPLDGAHSVPEPSTAMLLCLASGFLSFVFARRCRAA